MINSGQGHVRVVNFAALVCHVSTRRHLEAEKHFHSFFAGKALAIVLKIVFAQLLLNNEN